MADKETKGGFTYVQPQFAVSDVSKSLDYYTDVLGFEVIWVLHDSEGVPGFANVCRDELAVFLARHDNPCPSVLNAHADTTECIDQVFAELKEKGAWIKEPRAIGRGGCTKCEFLILMATSCDCRRFLMSQMRKQSERQANSGGKSRFCDAA